MWSVVSSMKGDLINLCGQSLMEELYHVVSRWFHEVRAIPYVVSL